MRDRRGGIGRAGVARWGGREAKLSPHAKQAAASDVENIAAPSPTPLVTGRAITPTTSTSQNVGSLPVNLIPVREGRFVVSTDAGYRQSLWVIRTEDGAGVSHVGFSNKRRGRCRSRRP